MGRLLETWGSMPLPSWQTPTSSSTPRQLEKLEPIGQKMKAGLGGRTARPADRCRHGQRSPGYDASNLAVNRKGTVVLSAIALERQLLADASDRTGL